MFRVNVLRQYIIDESDDDDDIQDFQNEDAYYNYFDELLNQCSRNNENQKDKNTLILDQKYYKLNSAGFFFKDITLKLDRNILNHNQF